MIKNAIEFYLQKRRAHLFYPTVELAGFNDFLASHIASPFLLEYLFLVVVLLQSHCSSTTY